MFTGIVKCCARVESTIQLPGLLRLTVSAPESHLSDLATGASISINGACLTATHTSPTTVAFDLIQETLNRTNLGTLRPGDNLHLERSLKFGDEIGGHILSGHIDTTGSVTSIENPPNNFILTIQLQAAYSKYLFPKGYIAIDGVSLTIATINKDANTFAVHLIPETLRATHLGALKIKQQVNIEIDRQTQAIVDTVERFINSRNI